MRKPDLRNSIFILLLFLIACVSSSCATDGRPRQSLGEMFQDADNLFNEGQRCFNEGNYDAAEEYFSQSLFKLGKISEQYRKNMDSGNIEKMDENFAEIWTCLGDAKWAKGKIQGDFGAIECYKAALIFNYRHAPACAGLGFAYGNIGEFSKAKDSFKDAIRFQPDYAYAHYGLGIAYCACGNVEESRKEYEVLKKLDLKMAKKLLDTINK